jgi:hypothetical protein
MGQIIDGQTIEGVVVDARHVIDDGRAGLTVFPFWMWTWNSGAGQEYIDHYYWAIATAGNKMFPDFAKAPEDQMMGRSILYKTINDLAIGYHPGLKRLIGPASRTHLEHLLGRQEGLQHIIHVMSPEGALTDTETGILPALIVPIPNSHGHMPRPPSAWGHDYPPVTVAWNSLTGPWAPQYMVEMLAEKPLPWYGLLQKKVVADGDWTYNYMGESYGMASIRATGQRIFFMGQWRRAPERPNTMRDIGTVDMRIGFNDTQWGNDGDGILSDQGTYRVFQNRNKVLMLAHPRPDIIARQAGEHRRRIQEIETIPAQPVRSVQIAAAFFNYEDPEPSWEIYVNDRRIDALPATAGANDVITIRDGVSYIALRALPTDDRGRDVELSLIPGVQQIAYNVNFQPALVVNAYIARRGEGQALSAEEIQNLGTARTGFALEMGDEAEWGGFEAFRAHALASEISGGKDGDRYSIVWRSGDETLEASMEGDHNIPSFLIDGVNPYAYAEENHLWQDSTLSQLGRGRLEKGGAAVERSERPVVMMLQTFPKQNRFVAVNPVPDYQYFRFTEPGGLSLRADGGLSMGFFSVLDSREVEIDYHPFTSHRDRILESPKGTPGQPASAVFIAGSTARPTVKLNGADVTDRLKSFRHADEDGWLVAIDGDFPSDDEIARRLSEADPR